VKRRKASPASSDGNTRLVYSTGGDAPAPEAAAQVPSKPGPGIRLRLERRASGRVATTVSGLPGSSGEVTALARELKKACGAGGAVKDGVLEIQGDHRDRIEAALASRGLRSKRSGG
jgi:translation initiation factor 1